MFDNIRWPLTLFNSIQFLYCLQENTEFTMGGVYTRHSIVVKSEVQHCSSVLQVLFGVKITFSILQTHNFTV